MIGSKRKHVIRGTQQQVALRELRRLVSAAKAPRLRTMREFAEQEVVIPSGQYTDLRYTCDRQPFSALWFEQVERPWSELVITGPSQSGKTLIGFVIPILYHLFELRETVIAAVPDAEMVRDKWEQDIEPVLSRTRYRELLPKSGPGSKGGKVEAIKFRHGPILRFMTAGGSDKSRAGFTSRVVCMTETDGFDVRTTTSDEADKIEQIEARMRSYPVNRRRIYKECTLSTDQGHTWRRYQAGTASKIALPCPHCGAWVSPEREDFRGWQDAESDVLAIERSQFYCPACGESWSEQERIAANHSCRLLHSGQSIGEDGTVLGPAPAGLTLGFRWSAVNNCLVPAGDVGLDEYKAARSDDEDNEERKMCQFVWAIPYEPLSEYKVELQIQALQERQSGLGKGELPPETQLVTVGIDVNLSVLHWTAIAWDAMSRGYVIDYGTTGVLSKQMVFAEAIADALHRLNQTFGKGWSENRVDRIAVDVRWETDAVIAGIKSLKDQRYRPFMGLGLGHWAKGRHNAIKVGGDITWVGDACHEKAVAKYPAYVIYADANYWKTWLHKRLILDIADEAPAGAITLYETTEQNPHHAFARHLTAEREVQRFEPGKGLVKIWEPVRSSNHWLDSTYIACVLRNRFRTRVRKTATGVAPPATERSYLHSGAMSAVGAYFTQK